jgi:ankyrin repeat protein
LNYALVADNKEIFCLLLAAGADINHGRSVLAECMIYAESARPDWTEFLLSHGADPNRKGTSADRFLPLIEAVLSGSTNRVAALLRYHADQSVMYENGADHFTPLALALDEGHLDVALVIDRANLQARANSASLAAYQGASESLRTLLAAAPNAVTRAKWMEPPAGAAPARLSYKGSLRLPQGGELVAVSSAALDTAGL